MTPQGGAWRFVVAGLRRQGWRFVAALITVGASGAVIALGPIVVRYGIDDGIGAGDRGALRLAVAVSAGLLVIGGLMTGALALLMVALGQRILHDLRCSALAGALRLDLADYESSRRGDIQARLTSDVEALAGASENLVPDIARDVILVVGGLVAVGILSPVLLLLALLVVPPAAWTGRWLARRSRDVYPALLLQNGVALGRLTEVVDGAPTIAALRAERRQLASLREVDGHLLERSLAAASMRNRFYSTLLLLQSVGTAAVVAGAGSLVAEDRISVGTAAAAILALAGVYGPLSLLIGRLDDVLSARTALVRVLELAEAPALPAGTTALVPGGVLRLDGVSYRYPGAGELAVDGLSLSVGPGEHVALVGATGSGKSTAGRLAVGLATPATGSVELGGVALTDASDADRRRRLLLVPQETFLLPGSIADNARLADPMLGDDAVEVAVDDLGLRPWIDSLPDGVATDVGPNGARLSAGERQLVTLLRVAVADPAVVVLDEATSVLDPEAEQAVGEALARLGVGRATIIVAHRPDTAARCDRIAVLDGGRLVQLGTHDELRAADGPYARLWATAG